MKYESRKFIDLILATMSKWANWDPPREIKVGDFGQDQQRDRRIRLAGQHIRHVFQECFGDSLGINLQDASLQPVTQERTDDYIAVSSRGVTVRVVDLSVGVDVQDVATVKFRVNCRFDSKSGAALVMYKPQLSSLPRDERVVRLLKEFHVLKGKYIVTEVTSCPAYILVMSTQEGESFSASLDASVPVSSGIAGGAAEVGWTVDTVHRDGVLRYGNHTLPIYRPLYRLKQPPPSFWEVILGRRGDIKQSNLIENWEDVRPPWDPLDEDGKEDEVYDAALEGEELEWDD